MVSLILVPAGDFETDQVYNTGCRVRTDNDDKNVLQRDRMWRKDNDNDDNDDIENFNHSDDNCETKGGLQQQQQQRE